MIQIAVCDDEKYYRDKIRELAAQFLEKRQLPYTVTVYSWGAYGTHPYVLLNYADNLDSVFTLAHEMVIYSMCPI